MDFSLHDLWWLKPKEQDNPLPALQLGVQIAQNKAKMDLAELDLANDIARTSLMREEKMAKIQLQTSINEGNSKLAQAASQIKDWSDPVQLKPIYDLGALYGSLVGTKGWEGIINTHERAVSAKRLGANTQSMIDRRAAQTELATWEQTRKDLLADSTINVNDSRLVEANEMISIGRQKQALEEQKFELQSMLADSTMDWNDARILEKRKNIDLSERRLLIQEGNLALWNRKLDQEEKRLTKGEEVSYKNELKTLNEEEEAKLKGASGEESDILRKLYNIKRRALTKKFYGDEAKTPRTGIQTDPTRGTNQPPAMVAPPMTNAPMDKNVQADKIRESFRAGTITKEEAMTLLQGLGFK